MTADQVIAMLAADYGLQIGTLEQTGYVIEERIEKKINLFLK